MSSTLSWGLCGGNEPSLCSLCSLSLLLRGSQEIMDPVTGIALAATVGQLVTMAFDIFICLHRYYRNVRGSSQKSAELRNELDSLMDLLSSAQEHFERHGVSTFPANIAGNLDSLRRLLGELSLRAERTQTTGFRKLTWPFKESDNIEILRKIERFKTNLGSTLSLQQA